MTSGERPIAVRVAVATTDGKQVNEHFAKARRFLVYEYAAGEWVYLEKRLNGVPFAGNGHCDHLLEKTADLIDDCGGVVVEHIGPGATEFLLGRRMTPIALDGPIDAALQTLITSGSIRFFAKRPRKETL